MDKKQIGFNRKVIVGQDNLACATGFSSTQIVNYGDQPAYGLLIFIDQTKTSDAQEFYLTLKVDGAPVLRSVSLDNFVINDPNLFWVVCDIPVNATITAEVQRVSGVATVTVYFNLLFVPVAEIFSRPMLFCPNEYSTQVLRTYRLAAAAGGQGVVTTNLENGVGYLAGISGKIDASFADLFLGSVLVFINGQLVVQVEPVVFTTIVANQLNFFFPVNGSPGSQLQMIYSNASGNDHVLNIQLLYAKIRPFDDL